ncbi:MAG TPA: MFS transporter [bacterium]|nr:MFS transporter [bacterium]
MVAGYRWLIYAVLSSLYVFSMFHRVSVAIITPDLVKELTLDPEQLGLLGATFFYAFALTQIPLGLLLDRYGPRLMVTVLALTGSAGTLAFASATDVLSASWSRALIGVGMAAVLMGTLKVFTAWFSPREFATLTGAFIAIGAMGVLLATTPLSLLVAAVGWREAFRYVALGTVLIAVLVAIVVRNHPPGTGNPAVIFSHAKPSPWKAWKQVYSSPQFWLIALSSGLRYGVFIAIQGLWLAPYLIEVLKIDRHRTSLLLLSLSIGYIVSCPLSGVLSDRVFRSRKKIIIPSLILAVLTLLPLVLGSVDWPLPAYAAILFLYGLTAGSGSLMLAHSKELFPLPIAATVMTSVNFFSFIGVASIEHGLGSIIRSKTTSSAMFTPEAFHVAFLICIGATLLSLIAYLFTRDTQP